MQHKQTRSTYIYSWHLSEIVQSTTHTARLFAKAAHSAPLHYPQHKTSTGEKDNG